MTLVRVVAAVLMFVTAQLPLGNALATGGTPSASPVADMSLWQFHFAPQDPDAGGTQDLLTQAGVIFAVRLDAIGITSSCVTRQDGAELSAIIDAAQVDDPAR